MKILILTCHSDDNRDLAGTTAANKWRYSARHGYDLLTIRMGWEESKVGCIKRIRELLPFYDAILAIGSDVVFTNLNIKIESLIEPGDGLVVAREHLASGFPLNNDVALWVRGFRAFSMLDAIITDAPEWLKMRWLWQEWLTTLTLCDALRLVEARVMNSCHQDGLGKWQPGDWIFHAMDYGHESKIKMCEYYLQAVKE